jgi:6-phosphogluconolactonase
MDNITLKRGPVYICATSEELADHAAASLARLCKEAIAARGYFSLALSGGSTPPVLYARLLKDDYRNSIEWNKIHFFIGDERCVPYDSKESNFGNASRLLLDKLPIPPENLHPTINQDKDPAGSAKQYEEELRKFFKLKPGEFPSLDLIMLGMGPDGHCASLFPGTKALDETQRLVVDNFVPKFDSSRITFTLPVLNSAREIHFMIEGAEKSEVLAEALEGDQVQYPVQRVAPKSGVIYWYIDRSAARDLCSLPRKQ